jgi:hypothetical protein
LAQFEDQDCSKTDDRDGHHQMAMAPMGTGPVTNVPVDRVKVQATYGTGQEETNAGDEKSEQKAAIERDVSVQCYVEPINPEYAYRVQPFVWMARAPDGREYLKVDYTAEPGYYPGVSTWWERTYSKPDPAFNLPWWWTTFKRDRTMLTKEMVATPAVPREGEVVEVAVTVRNKALVDARNVNVALWRGSPDNCLDEACLLDDNALSTTHPPPSLPKNCPPPLAPGLKLSACGVCCVLCVLCCFMGLCHTQWQSGSRRWG